MARVTTTQAVDVEQLTAELGAGVRTRGASPTTAGAEKEIHADVEQAALDAALAAHQFSPPAYVTKEQFMERFHDDEAVEIHNSRDPLVVKAFNTLVMHPRDEVNLRAQRTIDFVTYMETALREDGVTPILSAGRAAEILDPDAGTSP